MNSPTDRKHLFCGHICLNAASTIVCASEEFLNCPEQVWSII